MPISLKDLKKRTGTVDVYRKLGASRDLWDKLHVEYYLNPDLNMEDDARRTAALNGGDTELIGKVNSEYAVAIIASWDLLDEEGETIALDAETVRTQVPSNILTDCLTAIGKERASVSPSKKR
jgi:hypothetical protein